MKYSFLLLAFCILVFFSSCKKTPFHNEYADSFAAWTKFKKESGNSYQYTHTWGSWVGTSATMVVTVREGKITGRSYKYAGPDPDNPGSVKTYEEWQEDASAVNSHENVSASLTLDDVYAKARNEWLAVDKDENYIYFEAKNNGMISSCGYVPKGCADDCFRGITITSIQKYP